MSELDDLRQELVAAGQRRDSVQWADTPETTPVDAGYLCRRRADGFVLTLVERGREVDSEVFPDEHELVVTLRRRLRADDARARERARRIAAGSTFEEFSTLTETAGPGGPVEVSRSEVVIDGQTVLVDGGVAIGCVWVEHDGRRTSVPLLDVDSYTKTVVRARWRGQWLTVTGHVGADQVRAYYVGDADLAREAGLYGDVRDGWSGVFEISEVVEVEVERTPYDVPSLLARTRRPYALDQALQAAGADPQLVDWVFEEGASSPQPRDGRWTIAATRTGFAVGATSRGVFAPYDVFPTGPPAIELAVRLATTPLPRIVGTTPEQDEGGRRTGLAIVERTAARGGAVGAAGLEVGDLLDCVDAESAHHLYALGTPFSWRSQPPSDVGSPRFAFRVVRALPPEVREGTAAPWFGQPGGGAMVVLDRPIRWYVDQGHLEPVGDPMEPRLADFHALLDRLPGWAGISFRGLPPGPLPPVGAELATSVLTATSRSPRVATDNFAVRGLWAINGRSGRAIEDAVGDRESREVVFRPGSFFTVVKVARVGDVPVVLLEDRAFWEGGPPPGEDPLTDFAAAVATLVLAARGWDEVPVPAPGRFAGPIG